MQTALHLLTRDGAIRVAFSPRLTVDQYAELMLVAASPQTTAKSQLRAALQESAEHWGRQIEVADGADDLMRTRAW